MLMFIVLFFLLSICTKILLICFVLTQVFTFSGNILGLFSLYA